MTDREVLLRNPTLEAARAYCAACGFPEPKHDLEPLAIVHKMRLHSLDATDEMLAESRAFLRDNGFDQRLRGPEGLTPFTRDARRMMRGEPPLRVVRTAHKANT